MPEASQVESLGRTWLIRLRWLTLLAQAAAVGVAMMSSMPPDPTVPIVLLGLLAASNLAFALGRDRFAPPIGAVLVVDTLILTGLLHATGGPTNPFTALYFVYITLAAVLLGTRWVFGVLLLSLAGYAVLFFSGGDAHAHHMHDFAAHLRGMWIAFGVAAGLIAVFVSRLTGELSRRESELAEQRDRAARSAQVAALTSLAAGAAHELGTPIGTMVIAAGELERALEGRGLPDEVLEDVRLIRAEGKRCRAVLDGLSAAGGEARGEGFSEVALGALVERALESFGDAERARVRIEGTPAETAELPSTGVALALRNLLRNALDASAPDGGVEVTLEGAGSDARFTIADAGPGMAPDVRERATEPFFTTKGGDGMGLGLFLVRALAEQLGGDLRLESSPGEGTAVTLRLPRRARAGVVEPGAITPTPRAEGAA